MKLKILTSFLLMFTYVVSFSQIQEKCNQIVVKLKVDVAVDDDFIGYKEKKHIGDIQLDEIARKYNAVKITKLALGKKNKGAVYTILFPLTVDLDQVISEYARLDGIEYVEKDHIGSVGGVRSTLPNDQYFASRQWSLNNDGTFPLSTAKVGADIKMEMAWDIEKGSSGIIVGVIDTGTKLDHPEFSGRMWVNSGEIAGNGIDDDNNGFIDDINGWDFANNDNSPVDDEGHGTNVAGIIGANANNNLGYAGVDWHCKIMTLKALDNTGSGFYTWWASAIYYAVDHGAKVLNMSIGGTSTSTTLSDAINYALTNNVVVVACMMNTNTNVPYYPAAYSGVIAVGATNSNDERVNPFFWSVTSGSNYGSHISVVAPGNYIYGLNNLSNTNYDYYWGGTSQATPHVAGVSALLLAQKSSRTPAQIKSIIETTAEDQVGDPSEDVLGWDQYYGHGRLNAYKALLLDVLPVQLLSFTAKRVGGTVDVNWITAMENNSSYFEVQSSINGKDFQRIGVVDAAGNSSSSISYSFVDYYPIVKTLYYRLVQYDIDGHAEVSKVIKVDGEELSSLLVFPNPSLDQFTIESSIEDSINIEVSNMMGCLVYKTTIAREDMPFSFGNELSKGMYIMAVTYKGKFNYFKIEKQ